MRVKMYKVTKEKFLQIKKLAQDDYNRELNPHMYQYEKIEQEAWNKYQKIAITMYDKDVDPALDKYQKIERQIWNKYQKTISQYEIVNPDMSLCEYCHDEINFNEKTVTTLDSRIFHRDCYPKEVTQ